MSVIRLTSTNAGKVSAVAYTVVSLTAALVFLAITLATGDYSWVARIGGAIWIFGLSMIITMPTVTPWVRSRAAEKPRAGESEPVKEAEMVKDLVCGMTIDPATAAGSSEYKGQTYYFCALSCKKAFDEDPEKYIAGA
ncbi:MAG TPA: YHS domain-containing protein [Dehalococcoidia bacterium]|nr:YHS domain-containing protein [Dehalococcoidia bacterium]